MLSPTQLAHLFAHSARIKNNGIAGELMDDQLVLGTAGLDRACEQLAQHLQDARADAISMQAIRWGPEHRYFGWGGERSTGVEAAELWLIDANGAETLLCRSSEQPDCCMGALRQTSAQGEVLEVVHAGAGGAATNYQPGWHYADKAVLISGHQPAAATIEALAQRRAAALLCGPGPVTSPDAVVPRRLGPPTLFGEHRPIGFNLSARQVDRLIAQLGPEHPLRVRVKAQPSRRSGELSLLSASLRGCERPNERLLILADLTDPSAGASAVALVATLGSLSAAIAAGDVPPPRRTIELLFCPGLAGTVAWLHAQRAADALPQAALHLSWTPTGGFDGVSVQHDLAAAPTFVADLVADTFERLHDVYARAIDGREPIPWTPHALPHCEPSPIAPFTDPQIAVPSAWLQVMCAAPIAGRRNADQMAETAEIVGATAGAALQLANIDETDLPQLQGCLYRRAIARIARRAEQLAGCIERALDPFSPGGGQPNARRACHLLWLSEQTLNEGLRRERQILSSCGRLLGGVGGQIVRQSELLADLEQLADALARSLNAQVRARVGQGVRLSVRRRPLTALESRCASIIPVRRLEGPLPLGDVLRDARAEDRAWVAAQLDRPIDGLSSLERVLQWIDASRTLLDVFDLARVDQPDLELKRLYRFFEVLVGAGWIEPVAPAHT